MSTCVEIYVVNKPHNKEIIKKILNVKVTWLDIEFVQWQINITSQVTYLFKNEFICHLKNFSVFSLTFLRLSYRKPSSSCFFCPVVNVLSPFWLSVFPQILVIFSSDSESLSVLLFLQLKGAAQPSNSGCRQQPSQM